MRANGPRTYKEVNHWRGYQAALPERMRLSAENEPTEEWFDWRDARIHLDRFARADATATVIVLHGGGGYGRLLAPFGRALHARGCEVVLPDLPGYGLSIARDELFDYARWVELVVDLADAERRRSGRPVFVLGMSVGGYLGYLAAALGRNIAGVIATTLADPREKIVRDQFARSPRLNRLLTPLMPAAVALGGSLRLPIRWFANMRTIVNDRVLAERLSNDPLGGGNRVTLRFMHSLISVEPPVEPEEFDACPVLLAQPADDRWTTLEASLPVFDRLNVRKRLAMLEQGGHLPIEEPAATQLEDETLAFIESIAAEGATLSPRDVACRGRATAAS